MHMASHRHAWATEAEEFLSNVNGLFKSACGLSPRAGGEQQGGI